MLSQSHITKLHEKYGIDGTQCPQLVTLSNQELADLFGRSDVEGGGILITYNPEAGIQERILRVRLDNPLKNNKNGREQKYLSPAGQRNSLFVPSGLSLDEPFHIITEGEFKALCGFQRGLPVLGLPGIYGWKTSSEVEGLKISDYESLIPELKQDWKGHRFVLAYDSDIGMDHQGWPAFPKLAEQLYSLGADEVKVIKLPELQAREA